MANDRDPSNINYLSPLGYKFMIKKVPNTNYFVQACNVPGITAAIAPQPTPFVKIPRAGDHIDFSEFNLTFKVSEDFDSYLDIFAWICGYGFPDSWDQYEEIVAKPNGEKVYSDGTLIILNSTMNPNIEVTFEDMFPTALSDLVFDSREGTVDYITATATFAFKQFKIRRI